MLSSIALWWLAAEALGLVILPVCFALFRGLPDRGLGFSKILGLLALGYLTWLVEVLQFVDFNRATVFVFLGALAGGSAWLARRDWPQLRAFLAAERRLILGYEAIFLAGFLFIVWFRGFNPDIAGTEKPMDFALINGILRSGQFPPKDPWMSGFSISYYYFGYYLAALMIQLSGVAPAVGFNLALASVFGLAAVGLAALLYNLTGRLRYGVLGAFLTLLASNPDGFLRVLRAGTLAPQQFWWWWPSSRVLHSGCGAECIDEFPQFSFMLGDLHPHVMALPLAALALGVALAMLLRPEPLRWSRADWLPLLLVPVCAGALGFANTWDLPAYVGLVLAAMVVRQYAARPLPAMAGAAVASSEASPLPAHRETARVRETPWLDYRPLAFVAVASVAAYLPFYVGFQSQAGGFALVPAATSPEEFLGMWAFAFLLGIALLAAVVRLPKRDALVLALAGVVILAVTRKWLVALMLPLAAAGVWHACLKARDRKWEPRQAFALGLLAAGFGLIALCELVFLKDTFNTRMNTIFKFYYEAWLFLAIAGAYGAAHVAQHLPRRSLHYAWIGGVSLLCAAAALYPVASFYTKADELKPAWTLDGARFMRGSALGDLEAIDWLNQNVKGDAVIAEATGDEYSQFARFGTYTGLESVLGWAGHELQWRGVWQEQPKRIGDLQTLYTSADEATVRNLLRQYNVSYVVVGPLERQKYGNHDYSMFQRIGQVVFDKDGTTLYYVGANSGSNS
jgi:YYY domain-containing protein